MHVNHNIFVVYRAFTLVAFLSLNEQYTSVLSLFKRYIEFLADATEKLFTVFKKVRNIMCEKELIVISS